MRRLLTGILTTTLLLLNTVVLICPLLVFALLKLVLPGRGRDYASWAVMWVAETWSEIDKAIFALCIPTQWDIRGVENLRRDTSYLAVSNHQTWVDIPALIESLNRRTPFFKFFLKKELIWVPLLGLAWWGLDYPFMKRYSKAFLEKHPELRGKDLEITKAACELFKRQPVTKESDGKVYEHKVSRISKIKGRADEEDEGDAPEVSKRPVVDLELCLGDV
ncbi:acetyltransferase, partial [Pseudomonas putida]|uniref:acetyltransferase n=1 Tax=Pseudomonas putida TaxID=303 RepID=UPI00190FE2CB